MCRQVALVWETRVWDNLLAMTRLRFLASVGLLLLSLCCRAGEVIDYTAKLSPLIDPQKLATLGKRGANPRVQKYVCWLAEAERTGRTPELVASNAAQAVGMRGEAAGLTVAAMTRNLRIARELGCLDKAGLAEMRKGRSPTVRRGPYKGQELSVDHIIPRAACPELDNVIANLELLPQKVNSSKNDKVGERQIDLAQKLNRAGLLSDEGLRQVKQGRK